MKLIILAVTVLTYFYATHGINNGKGVVIHNFSYAVSIKIENRNGLVQCMPHFGGCKICTGGIIHDKFVLTAALCFVDVLPNVSTSTVGTHIIFTKRRALIEAKSDNVNVHTAGSISQFGKKVYFLKKFFETAIDNIAIVELRQKLGLTAPNHNFLQQLTFPQLAQPQDSKVGGYKSYDDAICLIAGYGIDKKQCKSEGILRKMHSRIIPHSQNPNHDHTKIFIANAVNEDGSRPNKPLGICTGDNGAPVVLLESRLTIIGVVSRNTSENCDSRSSEKPEEYMRVTNYLDFITRITSWNINEQEHVSFDLSY